MTDEDIKKLRGVVKKEIDTALNPVNTGLDNVKTGLSRVERRLDILWEQTDQLTKDMDKVKESLESHSNTLKQIVINTTNINDNVKRLDQRVTETEKHLGIAPPPESNII